MNKISSKDFEKVLLESPRWIDVRAPIEFKEGSVPGAVNLSLLCDEERHQIGIMYKQKGPEAAIELGHKLVSGSVKESRVNKWASEIKKNPISVIYCFRGGLRSQITQLWLKEIGIECPIIEGGYKALRQFFISILNERVPSLQLQIISGLTGSGKTHFLYKSGKPFIDLEKLANHRGSAFGAMEDPQPCQADFENVLALEILRLSFLKESINVENESRLIGNCTIPKTFFAKIKESPKIILDVPLDERVENVFRDYILESSLGKNHCAYKFNNFRKSIIAISKKLGGIRTQELLQDIQNSENEFMINKGLGSNRIWIRKLLMWYYDPMYSYSSSRSAARP